MGPRHVKMCLRSYADSEGPDPPAHRVSAQSDQGLYSPLKESLDTIGEINGEEMPRWWYQWRAKTRMRPCTCAG